MNPAIDSRLYGKPIRPSMKMKGLIQGLVDDVEL
jgi:hypothetical protein